MKLFEQLKKKLLQKPSDNCSSYDFRYLGMRDHLNDPIALLRANGIYSLFAYTRTHIFKSDQIVGNAYGTYGEESETLLRHAKTMTDRLDERSFSTNSDHYASNYEKTVTVGISG